ncbi:Transglutaminase-like superfamily protein [Tindallia magadiensis]|uniref:Transglutaminase-like superfamily protein n=1 Tax=Tindallia magadiensis TaxID=69895 RepID=A0A1I3G622_9FIRM|nr:transglutaminase-like domain-containing protein [Tindallia magadiensis]SFI18930.1 Transglutaminase-like superfamily protein [Tindallia magadiensis]
MKKWSIMLLIMGFMVVNPLKAEASGPVFDTSDLDRGVVHVHYNASHDRPLRVMITKGDQRYTYQLKPDGTVDSFPLQMGNGTYKIDVVQNIGGNRYSFVDSTQVSLALEDPNLVFLNSIQEIRWASEDPPIQNSARMIGDKTSKDQQIQTVYEYIINNYRYDFDKIPTLTSTYLPDIVQTYRVKKGICYDYSSLLAAMKRSEAIPVKLVKGYTSHVDEYHAWNEVYLNGQWHIIDSTVDAVYQQHGTDFTMIKNPSEYQKVYEY